MANLTTVNLLTDQNYGGKRNPSEKPNLKKSILKDRKLTKQVFEREEGILYNL